MENSQTTQAVETGGNGVSETSSTIKPVDKPIDKPVDKPIEIRLMSEDHAKNILDNVEKESPARWPAAVKTLVVYAVATIEKLGVTVLGLFAAVADLGRDLADHKGEYNKLVASHKRLAELTVSLRDEVRAPAPTSDVEGVEGVRVPDGTSSTMTTSAQQTEAASLNSLLPQNEVEAMMDAAIATARNGSQGTGVSGPAEQTVPMPSILPIQQSEAEARMDAAIVAEKIVPKVTSSVRTTAPPTAKNQRRGTK